MLWLMVAYTTSEWKEKNNFKIKNFKMFFSKWDPTEQKKGIWTDKNKQNMNKSKQNRDSHIFLHTK